MTPFYTCKRKLLFFACLIAMLFVVETNGIRAQTTLATPIPTGLVYYSDTDPGVIVFGVRNNNSTPIIVTNLSSYVEVGYGDGTYNLWYHPTIVTGAPTQVTAANGWVLAAPPGTITVTAAGVVPILSGLNVTIPANTTYRFALQCPIKGPFYGTAGSTGTVITTGGVDLYMQNSATSPTYAGAFSAAPANTPRSFFGSITFVPGNTCTVPPTAGNAVLVNNTSNRVCAGSSFILDLAGNTIGTGQTYQWQSSPNNTAWTNIGSATATPTFTTTQTATTYYRCAVTCGASTVNSSSIQVTHSLQLAGTYTIDNTQGTGGTNFQSFTDAFTALSCGVTGAVVFNVAAGQTFTETPPVLNATGTSTNTITFKKNGSGANPVIVPSTPGTIASSTTIGTNGDGIITINGGDYITFDGIDLTSNFSSGVDMYEYGYYLKKATTTDACKNVTIKNATINLNKATIYSYGIFVSNNSGTTTAITVVSTGGRSENIKIYGNTIMNSYGGIMVRGYVHASPYDFYDQNIEIGVEGANNIVEFGGGATVAYGIYTIYQNNIKIANNIVTSAPTGHTTTLYGIFATTSVNANGSIYNNTVTIHGKGTTTSIYALYSEMGGTGTNNTVSIYNNYITNCTYTSATTGSMYLLYIGGTVYKVNAYGNKLTNNSFSPTTTGSMYGLYQIGSTVNEVRINDNVVSGNTKTTGTTGTVYWLYNNTVGTATSYIYNDTITSNSSVSTTGIMYGIYQANGLANYIYKNIVSDLTCTATTTGGVYGIAAISGTANTIYNNFISNLNAPTSNSATDAVRGISLTSTTATSTANVYFNTIYLTASSSGADFNTSGIFHTTSTTATTVALTMKNNIIVNASTPNGAGYASAYRRSSGAANTLNNFDLSSNNNLFYAGNPSNNQLIFYDGTNADQTISAYKARVSPRESASLSESPNFFSAPLNLHIITGIPTQIESGGIPVTGITDDIDGNTRNTSTPDIGADEFTGISADLTGPTITSAPLPISSICIESKTITATIVDPSNINVTAGLKPRLWYKKETNADALPVSNTSAGNGWKWVEASNAVSPFSFTFNFALLSAPLAAGDSISYFIVAQDMAATPNVGNNTVTFSNTPANVALSAASFPTSGSIRGFRILPQPTSIVVKASKTDVCSSGTVTLDVDGVDITGASYQWQSTHHGTSNWVDINTATTVPYTTAVITDSTDFRLVVKCGGSAITASPSNVVAVNVNNPQVASVTGATRCGTGFVYLNATPSVGTDINWYAAPTGGSPLGSGNLFTTPSISSTTTYYAAAGVGGGFANVGMPAVITTNSSGGGTTNFGLVFDALVPFTLYSVVVYPVSASSAAGTVTIDVINSAGTVVHTATVNVVGSPSGTPSPQTVALNFNIQPGTNYKLRPGSFTGITGLLFDPAAGVPAGGNYGYPFVIPGVLSINTSTLTVAPTNTARNDLYYYFYNWQVSAGCEGTRVPVVATISTPPSLALSGNKTICNGVIDSVMVSSAAANFNSYTWSPTTGLFTDAACTIPYTGTNALKLYVMNTVPGKTAYKCTANNTATSCANEVADTVVVMPEPIAAANPAQFCLTGSAVLSIAPLTDYGNGVLQWQDSPNGTTYTNIAGANAATYTTPSLTSTTYYKLLLKGTNGTACSNPATTVVTVNNPQVTGTTPGTRCGAGSVNLGATASTGAGLYWYAASTGGTAIGSGSPFATPSISATTTYYVGAGNGGSSQTANHGLPTVTTATQNSGLLFNLNVDATLNSIDVYTVGTAGTVTLTLQNSSGTLLYTSPIFNVVAGTLTTPQTLTLDWAIPAGTGYRILVATHSPSLGYHSGTFPIDLGNGVGSVTTGATATGTTTLNYFIYNMKTTTGCTSARTAVVATVDNTPGCSVVPITLLSFKGEKLGAINKLEWTTSTEINNAGFELQRSADGVNFSQLAYMASRAVNGNSNSQLSYITNDTKPLLGNGYYRLKQIDRDGKSSYSSIVLLKGNKPTALTISSIYPNPSVRELNLVLLSPMADDVKIMVTDITGKVLLQKAVTVAQGDNKVQLNVQSLSQGTYIVKAVCGNGCESAVHRFVKQ